MFCLPLAYIGPETILPVISAVAAVGGAIMLMGRNTLRLLVRLVCGPFCRSAEGDNAPADDAV